MNKTFEINGRIYNAKEIDTKALCVFEECGLSIMDIGNIDKKTFSFVTAYIAFCGKMDVDRASNELNEHIINGGNLESVVELFAEALTESRFFQAIIKRQEENAPKTTKKKIQ